MAEKQFTMCELHACAAREVRQRNRVYPRWVAEKRMTQEFADLQIAQMGAIEEYFGKLASEERAKGDLFGGQQSGS